MMLKLIITSALLLTQFSYAATKPLQITVSAINTGPAPPFRWFDYCSNEWNGSAIQTVRRIFGELDVQVTFDIPLERSKTFSIDLREQLRSGQSDAILASQAIPSSGIVYLKTPLIQIGLGVFYPATMGKINSLDQLKNIPGYYYNRHVPDSNPKQPRPNLIQQLIQQWADKNKLDITQTSDIAVFNLATQGDKHFLIDSKYSVKIDRQKYNLRSIDIILGDYYFTLADRSPWKEMRPLIEEKMQYIRESGLLNLLEKANLTRWINEKGTNEACKNNFQP